MSGELVLVKGKLMQSPGCPSYRGAARLRLSWAPWWLRVDMFGHGAWLHLKSAPGNRFGRW